MDDTATFSAGEKVPPGEYIRIDIWSDRIIQIALNDVLPASHDGRVAAYRRLPIKHAVTTVNPSPQAQSSTRATESPAMRRSA